MEGKSLKQLQQELLQGSITCEQVVQYYLANIEKIKHLNAYVEVYADEAIISAKTLDSKIIQEPEKLGKLFGCIVSVKDLIVHKDHNVSAGSKILEGFVSQFDATCISALLAEDAIIIGRTNCDEFGMGSANTNSYFGPVKNGLNPERISGGSSGGAAVAVQMDTCLVAIGTDTGGSVRQPASMCGVYGYKPTYGLVSRYGLVAYASSFDQAGLLAKNLEDIACIMEVISVADEYDATMMSQNLFADQNAEIPQNIKIAYFTETIENDTLDLEIKAQTLHILQDLNDKGATIEAVNFDLLEALVPCYYILTTAEASSNLSRYDGVRYGYRSPNASTLNDMYVMSRTEGFGTEVKKRIMLGSFVLSEAYYDTYFTKAQQVRQMICDRLDVLFEKYDFLVMPTTPKVAWPINEKSENPLESYMADIYTVLANLAGIPAISVPLGNNTENMPFGIQVMGKRKRDKKTLEMAKIISKVAFD
ncbi:MAG: Asp-tRNA(Asn)/Glu-tRNA(Gln) amidotransferase subunit GatA [Saprospiraceae bacterium]|nr:Asp-tRNA(Asn)/Glu-tRNA(Gln) amidotransferase subunit GatA [Saprospiraceae bacterium]